MAKKVVNAFNGGEVSPYVYARTDNEIYDKSCIKMENFIPLEYGGATKRPSTEFVHEFTDTLSLPVGETKLYSFILNAKETFVLCFTNYSLSIFKDNLLITSIPTVFPDEVLQKLKFVQSNDVLFISSEDYPIQQLIRQEDDKFILTQLEYVFPPMGDELDVDFSPDSISGECTITAGSDYFEETHVGSFLVIKQKRNIINSSVSAKTTGGVTDSLNTSYANYEIESAGSDWAGKVVLEKSTDGGDSFSPEFTLVDTSAGTVATNADSSGNYTNRTFASTEKEGANTFIRLRFYPASDSAGSAIMRIKVDDPFVTGLFRIDSVDVDNRTATGFWISPIQDIEEGYTNNIFNYTAKYEYKKGDKIVFVGDFTADGSHGGDDALSGSDGTLGIAALTGSDSAGTAFDNNEKDFIDMCFSIFGSTPYMYALTNDDKVVRYNYSLSDGRLSSPLIKSLTYSNQYTTGATGRGQEIGQAHFGIASANDGNLYVVMRDKAQGTAQATQFTQMKINYFSESDFASGNIGNTQIKTLFARPENKEHNVFGITGLGFGNGKFYWKAHEKWRAGKNKPLQSIARYTVDVDGKNFKYYGVGGQYGKRNKNTANGTFSVHDHRLGQEPAYNNAGINDSRTMVRDQMDTVYLNGYLLCLDDRLNKIVFRNLSYKDTGLSYVLSDTSSVIDKTFWGMDSVPAEKLLGVSELIIGTKYKLVANVTVTAQTDYLKTVGFPNSQTTFNAGNTFIATADGLDDLGTDTKQNYGIKVVIDNSNIDRATNVDVNVIVLYKDPDATNGAIGDNPKLLRLSFDGEVDYYQATRDFDSGTGADDDYTTGGTFRTQRNKGLWAKSLPKIVASQESAFSSKNGYPNSISIFENRLCFGGNKKFPNRLWMSKIDDLNNFIIGSEDTAALDLKFNSLTQDEITWLCAGRELNIGTRSSEWTLGSGNQSLPVTPTQLNLKRRSEYGSSNAQGVLVNSAILFIMRQGKKIREWYLQNNQNDYLARDLTLIAEHIIGDGVKEIAVQTQPATIIWVVCNNGDLVGLTYERETNTFAWHRHTFDGTVESVAVIPQVNREDKVYLTIKNPNDAVTGLNVGKFNITIASSREDQQLTISGHSTSAVNGVYTRTSDYNSKHQWTNGVYNIRFKSSNDKWEIITISDSSVVSDVSDTGDSPPATGWSNSVTLVSNGSGVDNQEIEITADPTKHVTPRLVHGSGEASAIVLPVEQTNGTSGSISNITADVYGFKGRLKSVTPTNERIHIVPETLTVSGHSDSAVNVAYALTEDRFNQPAWDSGTHTIQVNKELTVGATSAEQGTTHGVEWQIINTETSQIICKHAYTIGEFPVKGGGGTDWTVSVGSGTIALTGNGHPFTSDHISIPVVYLNNTVSPNRTPDIGGLVHGQTYFLKQIIGSEGDQTPNRIITLKDSSGTIINLTDNSTALKAQTGGIYNLKNHFLASAVFATPRVNTFATGLSTSSNDTLYNTGSPSLNTNFSKTMTFADGDICGVEILLWNVSGSKEANDAFIEFEGDPTVTIDATEDSGNQTKVTLTYDSIGEYNIDLYIEDTGTGEVQTVKSGEGIQPRILDDRYLVQFDPQIHESAYTKKYSGLDLYVRNKNFTGSSFTGLDHLENKTVTYKVNGGTAQTATVSGGAINVGSQTNANVIVGLPYTSTLAPLYQDIQYSRGSTQGSKKAIQKATIRFKDTLSAKVGQTETDLDPVRFESTTALNTEDAEVWLSNANEFLQTVYVVSDTPQPCTVLAMVVDVEGV
jgi:hypothetical protein